jgi:hypothetical protein
MTREMSSTFGRAQIEKALEILASSAADQENYLERLGTAPCADELALRLEDFIVMLPAALRDGVVSADEAAAIRQVSDLTCFGEPIRTKTFGTPGTSGTLGTYSLNALVIGYRRSRPKLLRVIFTPGGA